MAGATVTPTTTIHTWPFDYTDYQELQSLISQKYSSSWPEIAQYMTDAAYNVDDVEDLCRFANVEREYFQNGKVCSFKIPTNVQNTTAGVSSNTARITRATVQGALNTGTSQAGKVTSSVLRGVGTKVATAIGKASIPLTIASLGVTLGKTIDSALYNANPDYWDSIGLSSLNPDKWASLIIPDNELGQDVFNLIFGIDPQTGEAQAYMDAEAMAYATYCMQQAGVFNQGGTQYDFPQYISSGSFFVSSCMTFADAVNYQLSLTPFITFRDQTVANNFATIMSNYGDRYCVKFQAADFSIIPQTTYVGVQKRFYTSRNSHVNETVNVNQSLGSGQDILFDYVWQNGAWSIANVRTVSSGNPQATYGELIEDNRHTGHDITAGGFNVAVVPTPAVPGIGDQTGAVVANPSGLSENEILPYLQNLYPDMFNNAINYDVLQPDGTVDHHTYVPITIAEGKGWADSQPVSGTQTQTNPAINPETSPIPIVELLTNLLQKPQPKTEENPYGNPIPPSNPTTDGDGSSPTSVVPVGSASSLWKIYHPTQAQIDSFGGWLWSSNFIDQILKIFNNPMEAVIGLHKVYATPIDAGTTTIKVGYLDSGVSSAYIEQQYITVSCGSVNLMEQFGNVFDYSPFTDVQLYLPFVGIVPLNVADVMRASISIDYGVDVITGACLAQVEVSRDNNTSVLYQYSGNCAVQYPISSGSYMGIVSSIISVAGGVAATVASGGAAAPLALGAAGGLLNAHTSVQHSGGFSGNAGAMGGKIPYLIITRPQTNVADNAETMIGFPANTYTTINECSGFIKAESVHVVNVNATDEELDEINNLFMSGIII